MNRTRIALLALVSCMTCFPGLPVAYGAIEAIRSTVYRSLCEQGWPDPQPGDPSLDLQSIEWEDGTTMRLGGLLAGENHIDLPGMSVHLPKTPAVTHDGSCGDECASAFEIDGLRCEDTSAHTTSECSYHVWLEGEERSCFLSLDGALPAGSLSRELGLGSCPVSMSWLPR